MIHTSHQSYGGKEPLRILFYNVGYATGIRGSLWEYFVRFYRYLWTPRKIAQRVRHAIYHLLQTVRPDVCCMVEVHRKRGFLSSPRFYHWGDTDVKYGLSSILRYLPFFWNNCNGFLSRHSYTYSKRYFRSGTKKLIYDIQIAPEISLLFAHFSLEQSVRAFQCREIAEVILEKKQVILCGDFNIFQGAGELHSLAHQCDLEIINAHGSPTFPAVCPTKTLDLFLCSRSLHTISATVLASVQASDHLPILLEVSQ